MMKKRGLLVVISIGLTAFMGCAQTTLPEPVSKDMTEIATKTEEQDLGEASHETQEQVSEPIPCSTTIDERYIKMKFESAAIKDNSVGEKAEKEVCVFLPPSYFDSEKRYPVVYYLHGYLEHASTFVSSSRVDLDEAFNKSGKEFILVGVNGFNNLGGSFYANSPVSGRWEDYVVDEVVSFVDENFRTIKESSARGICGFSMGGYGAYNIAMKHPDVFSAVLTMSPGAIADGALQEALETWANDAAFKRSYAQAFSPNPEDEVEHGNIPTFSGTPEDDAIVADWEKGYGNLAQKVEDYLALNQPLKAIKILYGDRDYYKWIPEGCEFFSKCLEERGVEHSIESFSGGHMLHPQVIGNYIVPFFNENLSY